MLRRTPRQASRHIAFQGKIWDGTRKLYWACLACSPSVTAETDEFADMSNHLSHALEVCCLTGLHVIPCTCKTTRHVCSHCVRKLGGL